MIRGTVSPAREAMIRVTIEGPSGQQLEVEAIIDTGYTGSLTLPSRYVASLNLRRRGRGRAILADGSEVRFPVYEAIVHWDGSPLKLPVDQADTEPLVGMTLLYGSDLHIQVIDGGSVTIQPLP
jgi:clan AA aspartic protease